MAASAAKARKIQIDWRPLRKAGFWLGFTTLIVIAAVEGAKLLNDPHHFPVRIIEVRGEFQHLDRQRLQQEVAEAIGTGFVLSDMDEIRQRIERLAWVDSLQLRRIWPDRLRMTVTEQLPLARWGDDALVNARGEVFRPETPFRPAGMVVLRASDESALVAVDLLRGLKPMLDSVGLGVESISLEARGDWSLEFEDGLRMILPQTEPAAHLGRFLQLYPALLEEAGRVPVRIDLRYDHGVAVRWGLDGAAVSARNPGEQRQ